jgi:predicted DNA-binding transcriptional regulator AlpA
MSNPKPTSSRGLDTAQLCARLGGDKPLDRSTLWRRIQRDPDFPKPFYIWNNAPRFVEAEVDAYIARRIAERDDPACAAAQCERLQRREQRLKAARVGGAPPSGGDAAIKNPKQISIDRAAPRKGGRRAKRRAAEAPS